MKKITALMAIGSLALAACGSSSSDSSSSSATKAAAANSSSTGSSGGGAYGYSSKNTNASNTSSASAAKHGRISVAMLDYKFGPKVITGKPGSTITVKLTNKGNTEHNFKIDSQKQADADVKPGKSASIKVKIPSSGSVQFYCEYHRGLGMTGTVKAS